MYKSCDDHSVGDTHFPNYPWQIYLITSCGIKEILLFLELLCWTNGLAFSTGEKCFVSYYFFCWEKFICFWTWNFSFKPAFCILEEVPNGHPGAWNTLFIHNTYKSFAGLLNHMPQSWALLPFGCAYAEVEMYDYFLDLLEVFWCQW